MEPVPYGIICRSLAWKANGRPQASKHRCARSHVMSADASAPSEPCVKNKKTRGSKVPCSY